MLSDMVGIYNSRAELKRLAGVHTAPEFHFAALQGTLETQEASKNIISFHIKTQEKYCVYTYKLNTRNFLLI